MQGMVSNITGGAAALLLLLFTPAGEVRADEAQSVATGPEVRQTPAWGPTVRVGTIVGFTEVATERLSLLGGQVAVGYRLGPVELEADYESASILELDDQRSANNERGERTRVGVSARLYVGRIGGRGSSRSLLRFFAEAGLGQQELEVDERRRSRNDAALGGGWLLDHRFRRRHRGLPFDYVGWHFGWRLAASKAGPAAVALCPASTCKRPPTPAETSPPLSLTVASSLSLRW